MPRPQRAYSRLETDEEVRIRLLPKIGMVRQTTVSSNLDLELAAAGLPARQLVWVYP